ncbi:MAG TPA: hypothetical protein VMH40_09060 [Myxococcaceae bacterium]|nr:hypothetical protein [Myxococcaceae bacterium]
MQRASLGGYLFLMDRTGAVTGGAGCDDTVLPPRMADNLRFDKLGAEQLEVVFRAQSLLPVDADGNVAFPADTADVGRGEIGASPDAQGICTVSSFTTAHATAAQDGTPPATPKSVTLSNTRFLSAPAYQGSQAETDATYTVGACSASYHGLLLTPIATCASDADCNPFADPANGRAAGSGVNPFYPVSCNMDVGALYGEDPGTGICWFTGTTFPQIQAQP